MLDAGGLQRSQNAGELANDADAAREVERACEDRLAQRVKLGAAALESRGFPVTKERPGDHEVAGGAGLLAARDHAVGSSSA